MGSGHWLKPSTAQGAFGLGVALGTILGPGLCGLALWRSGDPAHDTLAPKPEVRLLFPVHGASPSHPSGGFLASRGDRRHEAVDILAPRGSPVLAVTDGTVERLSTSARGGLGLYHRAAQGGWCFYYAHLERYAPGLEPGQPLARGRVVGYVGSTGNAAADAPHLHFAVLRIAGEEGCRDGDPVDPYPLLGSRP